MANSEAGSDQNKSANRAILSALQDLFILQASVAGVKRDAIREILGIGNSRISRITKHLNHE
jgi:hypothetical protein